MDSNFSSGSVPRLNRRALGLGALGVGATAFGLRNASAHGTPEPAQADSFLFVADAAASAIYLYSTTTLELTGQIDGITFGGHNGLFVLPDGRLIFTDDVTSE